MSAAAAWSQDAVLDSALTQRVDEVSVLNSHDISQSCDATVEALMKHVLATERMQKTGGRVFVEETAFKRNSWIAEALARKINELCCNGCVVLGQYVHASTPPKENFQSEAALASWWEYMPSSNSALPEYLACLQKLAEVDFGVFKEPLVSPVVAGIFNATAKWLTTFDQAVKHWSAIFRNVFNQVDGASYENIVGEAVGFFDEHGDYENFCMCSRIS